MIRRGGSLPVTVAGALLLVFACTEIPTGANEILSLQFDPLPSPAVVAGDSLRDSLGIVRPATITAFNYNGGIVENPAVRFLAIDRGIRVDSATGIVVGDSVRTAARINARIGNLSVTVPVAVTIKPDSAAAVNSHDSLSYVLTDTLNVSSALQVKVINTTLKPDSAKEVGSWLVSFLVNPADSAIGKLVGDGSPTRSSIDTTDASGVAGRRVRIDVSKLRGQIDSVRVQAFVRYRGVQVKGSPVLLVLKLKPK